MTDEIQVEIDPAVFNDAYLPHLTNTARTQIYYGGSSSGKSVFLAQRYLIWLMQGGRNMLICRAVGNTIRRSVFNEITKLIKEWGISHLFKINKSEMAITCTNGYQILFSGLDDVEKLKSITPAKGVITDIWVEEATETQRNDIKQLRKRLRGRSEHDKTLTLSFNPILKSHHIYADYFADIAWADDQTWYESDTLTILKTTYRDNKFLDDGDIADLEGEKDGYFYEVYTLGNWGVLGDVIFTNWRVEDLSDRLDEFDNLRDGLDFGFSKDPSAYIQSHFDRKRGTIYITGEMYSTGLTNQMLANEIREPLNGRPVLCDSADPRSIRELGEEGISAIGAAKGPDSIRHGIQWLQNYNIVIHVACVQFKKEIEQYQWKQDKDGNAIPVPIDKNDHGIDALRYSYSVDMTQGTGQVTEDNPFYD